RIEVKLCFDRLADVLVLPHVPDPSVPGETAAPPPTVSPTGFSPAGKADGVSADIGRPYEIRPRPTICTVSRFAKKPLRQVPAGASAERRGHRVSLIRSAGTPPRGRAQQLEEAGPMP